MQSRMEDRGEPVQRYASVALLALSLFGCGSPVTVAEQKAKVDASDASDAGGANDADSSDGVPCGDVICSSRPSGIPGVALSGCCADFKRSKCGVSEFPVTLSCVELGVLGKIDTSCSSGPTISGIGPLPGCCRENDTCGVMESTIGLGCTSLPGLPLVATQNCVY